MKTRIQKNGDTVIISVDGKLDFEGQEPFRQDMTKIVAEAARARTDSTPKNIIFNMENLEFVGSSGISAFVQTLKDVNAKAATKPRYCGVRSEFRRIMKAFDEEDLFEFFETEERAKKSFDQ